MTNATPSMDWRESVGSDEAERHASYAKTFASIQSAQSQKHGRGRTLHRKQHAGAAGKLEVLAEIPAYAKHGLFATPGVYDAWVRLSSGGAGMEADKKPDIRGFAIKVHGVKGEAALGNGPAVSQDFLLINQPSFGFPSSHEFIGIVRENVKGPGAFIRYLFSYYGFFGGLKMIKRFAKTLGRKFSGFASEPFFSAAPIACGPYAVRVRMLPEENSAPQTNGTPDWGADFARRLKDGSLRFKLQLQFFVNDTETPIEDTSVEWKEEVAPFVTVATLTLPQQDLVSKSGKELADKIEEATFDPWSALVEHRPLGEVMRARKVVYYQSQLGRKSK